MRGVTIKTLPMFSSTLNQICVKNFTKHQILVFVHVCGKQAVSLIRAYQCCLICFDEGVSKRDALVCLVTLSVDKSPAASTLKMIYLKSLRKREDLKLIQQVFLSFEIKILLVFAVCKCTQECHRLCKRLCFHSNSLKNQTLLRGDLYQLHSIGSTIIAPTIDCTVHRNL